MSLFKRSSSGSEETKSDSKVGWKQLTDLAELNTIVKESNEKAVVIFKHSTRCGISRMVLKQFENEFHSHDTITPYFLDLLAHRDISNAIATRFLVAHQSPQMIVIKEGVAVYSASHESIDAAELQHFI
jgi:bacillithiol system protein YtxJ